MIWKKTGVAFAKTAVRLIISTVKLFSSKNIRKIKANITKKIKFCMFVYVWVIL